MSKSWKFILPVTIAITLTLAFCFVQPVFAQDELPPEEIPVVEPLAETPAETPIETPLETPTDLPHEEPVATEEPVEPPAEGEPVEEAPTEIVLLDETGEPLSMASQVAADIMSSDPYFLAAGVYYGFSATGICPAIVLPINCTTTATPIQAAIDNFALRGASGAITVEAGTYTEALININGISGLTGLIGAGSDPNIAQSILTAAHIVIQNQAASFTLRGFYMDNISYAGALVLAQNNTGTLTLDDLYLRNPDASDSFAINIINHTGNVVITNVEADRCGDEGATITATGSVTITNSSFDDAAGDYALKVTSANSSITLNHVSASQNVSGEGANLQSKTGITIRNSYFYHNANYGVYVPVGNRGNILIENTSANNTSLFDGFYLTTLAGTVTMTNVRAESNMHGGVVIHTCHYDGFVCTGSGAVTITNGVFTNNPYFNLRVYANGAITLNNVEASNASVGLSLGAHLENQFSTSASAITITHGIFNFNSGNDAWGLRIASKGSVTLNHVSANNNTLGGGIRIDNSFGTGSVSILATQGSNEAYVNDGSGSQINNAGLYVVSRGSVTINSLSAPNNSGVNIYVDNSGGTAGVTITNTLATGNNVTYGVEIHSRGLISLNGVNAGGNPHGGGFYLDNSASASKAGVTIVNSDSTGTNNAGVLINTLGPVNITNLNAQQSTIGSGLFIYGAAGAINITGGYYDNNNLYGVYVYSGGKVTIKNIQTNNNAVYNGLYIDNTNTTSSPAVSVTNLNADQNSEEGLRVISRGQINLVTFNIRNNFTDMGINLSTLSGVAISSPGARSIVSNNCGTNLNINAVGTVTVSNIEASGSAAGLGIQVTTNGPVTISNSYFDGNYNTNIDISTNGSITLTNVDSLHSVTAYGAYLQNNPGTGSITISGGSTSNYNDFNYNYAGGIYTDTTGALTFSNVAASYNRNGDPGTAGYGISLANPNTGNVTMTNIYVTNHPLTGIYIQSLGTVTLTNITSMHHHSGEGLYIENTYATTPRTVTITGLAINGAGTTDAGECLEIRSDGAITVRNFIIANCPTGYAMYLNNMTGTAGVTLSGASIANPATTYGGGLGGIVVDTKGAVSLTRVTSSHSNGSGGIVINNSGSTTSGVTMTNVSSNYNDRHGIWIRTNGSVTLNIIEAKNNGAVSTLGNGVLITSTGAGTVSITNGYFNTNYLDHLYVTSLRQITLNGVNAIYSTWGTGLYLDNSAGTGGVSITGNATYRNAVSYNRATNIYIKTNGIVSLQNTISDDSGNGSGVMIYNDNSGAGTSSVTISNLTTDGNDNGTGIFVQSCGTISLTGSTAHDNETGFYLNNDMGCPNIVGITITNSSSTLASDYGLQLRTRGNVTLTQVTGSNSGTFDGARIDYNDAALTAVTNISRSTFNGNNGYGLFVLDGGNVTLNSITAQNNGNGGVIIDNNIAGSLGTVTLLASYGPNRFIGNGVRGLDIGSNGAVTINNINANLNGEQGLYVDNTTGSSKVTVTGGTLNQNAYQGAFIRSNSTITLANLQVFSNGVTTNYEGIYLYTSADAGTIQNSQIIGNGRQGIYANLGAAILTVKQSTYFGNNQYSPNDSDPNIFVTTPTTLVVIR